MLKDVKSGEKHHHSLVIITWVTESHAAYFRVEKEGTRRKGNLISSTLSSVLNKGSIRRMNLLMAILLWAGFQLKDFDQFPRVLFVQSSSFHLVVLPEQTSNWLKILRSFEAQAQ